MTEKVKGGKREGAGRPAAPPTLVVRIRLTPAQHAAYVERGAEIWLKRVLSDATAVEPMTSSQALAYLVENRPKP